MDFSQLVNIIGLAISFIGAFLVFINTPKVDSLTRLFSVTESNKLSKKDKRKNKMGKAGMFLIFIGFGCQLASNFV